MIFLAGWFDLIGLGNVTSGIVVQRVSSECPFQSITDTVSIRVIVIVVKEGGSFFHPKFQLEAGF